MFAIIMGAGRTGSLLAQMLVDAKHDVTVIDWNASAFSNLPDEFPGRTILGNAVDQDVMRRAGIERADAFVAATGGDNRNIMAGQIARQFFDVPKVVARIKDPIRADIYCELGLDVDCRTTEGARVILDLVAEYASSHNAV